ncbi:unnamed protein product [Linum tenue]|uniref:Uncharacterized protein n=1 Tax=Linum tenue TaxID=586396 RepID=A0AAV0M558_9ROSI|nr:unnamed protein product [Linum tenue]
MEENSQLDQILVASSSSSSSNGLAKGGFRALPFIIVTDGLEKVVTYGLGASMILYLTREYGLENAAGAQVMFIWTAAINFVPVLAAFLADSYVGRYWMIGFGSIASILGTFSLWLTAAIPEARPQHCAGDAHSTGSCRLPATTTRQLMFLYASLGLISIGSGSMRSSCMAFGADQMMMVSTKRGSSRVLESIFSWYYISTAIAILLAITVIVYIQDSAGWSAGFGVCVVLMVLSAVSFFSASVFYVKPVAKASLYVVFEPTDSRHNHPVPADAFRFLNKACIIQHPEQDLTQEGKPTHPWRLCTVEQVEDLKSVIRIIPIWSAGMLMSVTASQQSIQLLQLATMDRHITPKIEIPAGSFSIFLVLTLLIWVPLYDRAILPLASTLRGRPVSLPLKTRLGLGILLSSASMAALGLVESIRRARALDEGLSDDPNGIVDMSAMWFLLYYVPFGVAEAFNYIGQNEFYYSELPRSMASISTTLYQMGLSVSNLVASLVLSVVDRATRGDGGGGSWVGSNINKGHYDYYYWVLAVGGQPLLTILSFHSIIVTSSFLMAEQSNGRQFDDGEDDNKTALLLSRERRSPNPMEKKQKKTAAAAAKGGFRTIPFTMLNEAFQTLVSTGLNANMVIYLTTEFHMAAAAASSVIYLWSSASSTMAIFGASLGDSSLGRFRVILLCSCFSLLGTTLLWSTAMLPDLRPPQCKPLLSSSSQPNCSSSSAATRFQLAILYSSLAIIALGSGSLLPCSLAFGADQLHNKDNPDDKALQGFFNWYYVGSGTAALLGLTLLVYAQDAYGWEIGLGVSAFLILFSTLLFLLPSSSYVKHEPESSLLVGCFRVVVAAVRKAADARFENDDELGSLVGGGRFFHGRVGSDDGSFVMTFPTHNFRCLNRACFMANPETDINPSDGSATDPWSLCTVEEVEALKSILRVLPVWSTGILFHVSVSQYPLITLQAETMNRRIFPNSSFQSPPASLNSFGLVSFTLSIILYESVCVPLLAKVTGDPRGISNKVRIGAGMVLSMVAMALLGVVESVRRGMAIQHPDAATVDMSVLWLVPTLALLGMALTLNAIGQVAFYYSQLPKSMASIAASLSTMSGAVGSLVSSLLINAVDGLTSGGEKVSWLSTDLDEGHLDYYYLLIAGLCLANFVYFLLCCRAFTSPAASLP